MNQFWAILIAIILAAPAPDGTRDSFIAKIVQVGESGCIVTMDARRHMGKEFIEGPIYIEGLIMKNLAEGDTVDVSVVRDGVLKTQTAWGEPTTIQKWKFVSSP